MFPRLDQALMTNPPLSDTTPNVYEAADTVDAVGLRCPLPLLKAKQALNKVLPGQCVRVLATDKGSVKDFNAFARLSGHTLEAFVESDGTYEYVLRKKRANEVSE